MKKARVTKILVEGNPALLKSFSDEVEKAAAVQIEKKPHTSLMMLKAKDSVSNQPFYAGELLVTECIVSINGSTGIGIIKGEEEERSYQLAVVDAAITANLPLTKNWPARLEAEEEQIKLKTLQESARMAKTKVDFHTMEEYKDGKNI
ncbi:phosphonate C-P lyase system protein PhnG [Bacillaceae bacterium Marseille-Q3522]|nr:phosphonate C-P lyase system protein PhnG [Bacillaceae bacterium Marseille-Q3522]